MPENGNGHKSISEIIEEWTPVEEALDKAFYGAVLAPPGQRPNDVLR